MGMLLSSCSGVSTLSGARDGVKFDDDDVGYPWKAVVRRY